MFIHPVINAQMHAKFGLPFLIHPVYTYRNIKVFTNLVMANYKSFTLSHINGVVSEPN